jgi:integrase
MGKARREPDAERLARRVRVGGPGKRTGGNTGTAPWADLTTVAHLNDYEGRPGRRPFTYDELQVLFDYLDERVERVAGSGRKGALAALRDAQMIKTAYAFGLRRNELCRLDVADLRPNPHMRDWGTYGSVHVRYGKAIRGGIPRRRTQPATPRRTRRLHHPDNHRHPGPARQPTGGPRPAATDAGTQRHTGAPARRPPPPDLPSRRDVNLNSDLVPTCRGLRLTEPSRLPCS